MVLHHEALRYLHAFQAARAAMDVEHALTLAALEVVMMVRVGMAALVARAVAR